MIGDRVHETVAAGDPAPRRTVPEQTGWVSLTARRFAEVQALAAADRYRVPETREELLAMRSADQTRTYLDHREVYDRFMHGEAP
ncbi:hypothetical protein [Streptomyces sp. MAR25Y5]|uniref:hypothetical protein n=1 Tax=Streptomyces sp. MAR25Y5 TaxID=2962028 RepID=UPI0020B8AFB1|nr:hypothetical protein [Streptomyces sp. MAR25Y5]MCP3769507.1 hypothetical protein [Streptomyces sp. MAR25Y5]